LNWTVSQSGVNASRYWYSRHWPNRPRSERHCS
jgi:hypothetical protein